MLGESGHAQSLLRSLGQAHQDLVLVHGDAAPGLELTIETGGDGGGGRQEGAPGIHLDLVEPTEALLLQGVALAAATGRLQTVLGRSRSPGQFLAVGGLNGFLIALSPRHLDILGAGRRLHHRPLCGNHLYRLLSAPTCGRSRTLEHELVDRLWLSYKHGSTSFLSHSVGDSALHRSDPQHQATLESQANPPLFVDTERISEIHFCAGKQFRH